MIGLFCFVLAVLASPFKSKLRLEAEDAVLRHQLIVLRRRLHGRVGLTNHDRWFVIQLYRWFPSILKVLTIMRRESPSLNCQGSLQQRNTGCEPSKQFHRHLSAMQAANLAGTSGHASNDQRSADIGSLDDLRIKSLRPSIIRGRMNDT
jgi:hypothetical protein